MNAVRILRRSAWTGRIPRSALPLSQHRILDSRTLSFRSYSTEGKPAEATPESSAPAQEAEPPSLSKEEALIVKKDAEILELQNRLLYLTADFQNLQRITEREKHQAKDFAISKFANDLLATVDVLALALKSVPSDLRSDPSANPQLVELYQGIEITERQLLQTLAKHGVKPYDPLGEKFDPNRHDALYSAPAPEGREPGQVIDVQKLGYTIKDRTLRAPQVGVAAEKAES